MKIVMLFLCLVVVKGVFAGEPLCSPFSYHEALLEKMIKTEFSFETLKTEFKQLRQDVEAVIGTLKSSLEGLEKEKQDMFEQFAGLNETTFTKIDKFLRESEEEVKENGRRTIERLAEDLRDVYGDMEKNRTESMTTPIVGFKALHVKNRLSSNGDILVFESVMLNQGNGYNKEYGIFTAPCEGLYLFTVQMCLSSPRSYVVVQILVEGKEVGRCNAGDDYNAICNSADAVAYLKSGDDVLVKQINRSGSLASIRNKDRLISFSGALINKGN